MAKGVGKKMNFFGKAVHPGPTNPIGRSGEGGSLPVTVTDPNSEGAPKPKQHDFSGYAQLPQSEEEEPTSEGGEGDGEGSDTVLSPTDAKVELKDGRVLTAQEYADEVEAQVRQEVEAEKARLFDQSGQQGGDEPPPANDPPPDPDPDPELELEFDELTISDDDMMSPADQQLIDTRNKDVQTFKEHLEAQKNAYESRIGQLEAKLDQVSEMNEQSYMAAAAVTRDKALAEASAKYDVSQEDIFAVYQDTEIEDINILGELAQARKSKDAEGEAVTKGAQQERIDNASKIGTGGRADPPPSGANVPGRGVKSYKDTAGIAKAYNWEGTPPSQPNV